MSTNSIVISLLAMTAAGAMLSADRVPRPTTAGSIPWLHGFEPVAKTETPSAAVVERLARWQAPDESCSATAYGGLALELGDRTILASYTQGAVVVDHEDRVVARLAPLACAGSADEIELLAVGDAGIGQPAIAMVITNGGHRTKTTWFALLRVHGDQLEPVFAAPVEETRGRTTHVGDVTVMPGTLIYRAPDGAPTIWTYDGERGVFAMSAAPVPNA
jgi:hypothetical protein